MKSNQEKPASILADIKVFDYLKEKTGDRKTKTEAYCDLLNKSLAGFVSPFLRKQDYGLRPCQCHVTVSDLAAEWRWHRATVRSFLDTLESFGQLERTRLTKSVVITMPLQTGEALAGESGQEYPDLAARLRGVLSGWITGQTDSVQTGTACGQFVRQAMSEAGVEDRPCTGIRVNLDLMSKTMTPGDKIRATAMGCIALAAMQRVLRKSKFDDILDFMDFSASISKGNGLRLSRPLKSLRSLFSISKRAGLPLIWTRKKKALNHSAAPFWHSPHKCRNRWVEPEQETDCITANNPTLPRYWYPASYREASGLARLPPSKGKGSLIPQPPYVVGRGVRASSKLGHGGLSE